MGKVFNSVLGETGQTYREISTTVTGTVPEVLYPSLSIYTMILVEILKTISSVGFVAPQHPLVGPLWNGADAACSFFTGVNLLLDKKNHRSKVTKLKGVINLGNSVQLATLTIVNFALFGGPAFAVAFGIGFLLSLDDMIRAIRRSRNFSYYAKDSAAEYKKNCTLIPQLQLEIEALQCHKNKGNKIKRALVGWALKKKQKRLKELKETQEKIAINLIITLAAKKYAYFEETDPTKKEKLNTDIENSFTYLSDSPQLLKIFSCENKNELNNVVFAALPQKFKSSKGITVNNCEEKCKELEKNIHDELKSNVKSTVIDSFIWFMAFAGMLIVCFPPAYTVGLVVVGIASALYIVKNFSKLKNVISSMCKSIKSCFSHKEKSSDENNDTYTETNSLNRILTLLNVEKPSVITTEDNSPIIENNSPKTTILSCQIKPSKKELKSLHIDKYTQDALLDGNTLQQTVPNGCNYNLHYDKDQDRVTATLSHKKNKRQEKPQPIIDNEKRMRTAIAMVSQMVAIQPTLRFEGSNKLLLTVSVLYVQLLKEQGITTLTATVKEKSDTEFLTMMQQQYTESYQEAVQFIEQLKQEENMKPGQKNDSFERYGFFQCAKQACANNDNVTLTLFQTA